MSTLIQPDLAMKVLSGEASPEESSQLNLELENSAEARTEFEDLKGIFQLLRDAEPVRQSIESTEPELPRYALESLHSARRQVFKEQLRAMDSPVASRSWLKDYVNYVRAIFATGAVAILFASVSIAHWSDTSVEVGMYRDDVRRSGGPPLLTPGGQLNGLDNQRPPDEALSRSSSTPSLVTPTSVNAPRLREVKVQLFDLDQPFDEWKVRLAWYQHGKVWVDNEKNLLHILSRTSQGTTVDNTEPLAPTDSEQHAQILKAVQELRK